MQKLSIKMTRNTEIMKKHVYYKNTDNVSNLNLIICYLLVFNL